MWEKESRGYRLKRKARKRVWIKKKEEFGKNITKFIRGGLSAKMRYRKILCERVFTISTSDESESIYEEKKEKKGRNNRVSRPKN